MDQRRHAGRGKAQKKAIHDCLMRIAAGMGEAVFVFKVAAVAVAALEVAHVRDRGDGLAQMRQAHRGATHGLPVAAQPDGDTEQRE